MTVYFTTPGHIDTRAMTVMGLNAKEKEDAIGYFGTGLKYAMAVLVREGAKVEIAIDDFTYDVFCRDSEFRGKAFKSVWMSRHKQDCDVDFLELPFTTELGKNWELWMAFRELWCNTLDEDGAIYTDKDGMDPSTIFEGPHTIISVDLDKFENCYNNRGDFIINTKPICKGPTVEVHPLPVSEGATRSVFYRGIKGGEIEEKYYMFRYNILVKCDLTEDRTLKHIASQNYTITAGWQRMTNKEAIQQVLTAPKGTKEHEFDWNGYSYIDPSEQFADVLKELVEQDRMQVPFSAVLLYNRLFNRMVGEYETFELDAFKRKQWHRATKIAKAMGHDIEGSIVTVQFVKKLREETNVMGFYRASTKTIYITDRAFERGTKTLVCAIIEELTHHETGLYDGDRELQYLYLEKYVTLFEQEVMKEPI